jgi:DnaJ-class molecular chaperone
MASKLEDQILAAEAEDVTGDGGDEDEVGAVLADDSEDVADEGEQAEAEPEPEDTEPSQLAIIGKLEAEHTRHRKALEKIMGDGFAAYDDCPVCSSMGYVPGSPLKQDSKVRTCEHCAGFGQVLTGAIPPGEAIRQCPDCLGNGHVPAGQPEAPAFTFTPTPNGASLSVAPPTDPEVARLQSLGYTVLPPLPTTP